MAEYCRRYLSTTNAHAVEVVAEEPLAHFIANNIIMGEKNWPEVFEMRIFKETFYGDCQNPGPDCPTAKLFASISKGGVSAKAFYLGKAIDFTSLSWKNAPAIMDSSMSFYFSLLRNR